MAFRDLSTNLQINENECFSNNAFIVNSSRNIKLLTRTLNKLKTFENLLKKSDVTFEYLGKTAENIAIDDDLKFDLKELSKINKDWFYKYNN